MIYNEYLFLGFTPKIPTNCNKPPTIYAILNSIVNFGKSEKEKIKDLAKYGRSTIFDFSYPLSTKVNKEEFECMILNHFLMRRIGLETVTAFKIQLNVKLNEIMPLYNKLFDLLYDNDLLGEITKRQGTDNRTTNTINSTEDESQTKSNKNSTNDENSVSIDDNSESNRTTNTASNEATNLTTNTSDKRHSDTPQNELSEVRNGNYITDYNYDSNTTNSTDSSTSEGTSENRRTQNNRNTNVKNSENTENNEINTNNKSNSTGNTQDDNVYQETITKINKFDIYLKMNEDIKNIYTMIFKDLDCLFYQLV